MCDVSRRLVVWMDGELAENESAIVARHVRTCVECRRRVAAYEDVSQGFAAYYHAATQTAIEPKPHRNVPRWAPVAAAAAVAAMLMLALLPRSVKQAPAIPPTAHAPAPAVIQSVAQTTKPAQRRRVAAHRKTPAPNWAMAGPAIRIAIPADEIFPPGAVPEGVAYIANLSLAADGSVQGLRLQP